MACFHRQRRFRCRTSLRRANPRAWFKLVMPAAWKGNSDWPFWGRASQSQLSSRLSHGTKKYGGRKTKATWKVSYVQTSRRKHCHDPRFWAEACYKDYSAMYWSKTGVNKRIATFVTEMRITKSVVGLVFLLLTGSRNIAARCAPRLSLSRFRCTEIFILVILNSSKIKRN